MRLEIGENGDGLEWRWVSLEMGENGDVWEWRWVGMEMQGQYAESGINVCE